MRKEKERVAPARPKAAARKTEIRKGVRKALGNARAFARRIAVKMLASAFVSFTIVFVTASCVMLIWELVPWITREGVTDIDPLPIIAVSFILAFAAMYARYLLMKRFSRIRP